MYPKVNLLVIFLFSSPIMIKGYQILVIWPLPAVSHFNAFKPLFEETVTQGHEVTIISGHMLSENLRTNYTHIDLSHKFKYLDIEFGELRGLNRFEHVKFCFTKIYDYSEEVFHVQEVQDLLRSNRTFDLVMGELFFLDSFLSFGYHFNAPVLGLCPQTLVYHDWRLANPFPVSYVPHIYLPFTEEMSFMERLTNAGYNLLIVLYTELIAFPRYQRQMEKNIPFGSKPVPRIQDVVSNVSVVLVHSHYSINFVRPMLPNIIPVAGLDFKARKPLPEDIQKFMDDAPDGVINVFFGVLIESEHLEKIFNVLTKIFSDRRERLVIALDSNQLTNIPTNFLIKPLKLIPQADVLHHRNCRLFITHGGLGGVLESINSNVPLIGVPYFSDQHHNIAAIEHFGIGKLVALEDLDTDLLPAVEEILNNTKYYENVRKRSRLLNSHPLSPLETAMFWVDHVLEFKEDTSHLKPESIRMSWFTYFSLDIIFVILMMFSIIFYSMFFCFSKLLRLYSQRHRGNMELIFKQ